MKPFIGINCDLQGNSIAGHTEGKPHRISLNCEYYEAIERAGGIPVLLAPLKGTKDIKDVLKRLDGLVLSGGDDIWPERYGQKRHARTITIAKERDIFDLRLIRLALDLDMPVMGICYGAQLINVATGGNLIQDLPSQRPSRISHNSKTPHKIKVERGTHLYNFLKTGRLTVNSSHHQAINRLGEGLKVSAMAEDGVVEAVESTRHSLVIGVQWHPERMPEDSNQCRLFTAFVEEVKKDRVQRNL